jgi:hypothetical protein
LLDSAVGMPTPRRDERPQPRPRAQLEAHERARLEPEHPQVELAGGGGVKASSNSGTSHGTIGLATRTPTTTVLPREVSASPSLPRMASGANRRGPRKPPSSSGSAAAPAAEAATREQGEPEAHRRQYSGVRQIARGERQPGHPPVETLACDVVPMRSALSLTALASVVALGCGGDDSGVDPPGDAAIVARTPSPGDASDGDCYREQDDGGNAVTAEPTGVVRGVGAVAVCGDVADGSPERRPSSRRPRSASR